MLKIQKSLYILPLLAMILLSACSGQTAATTAAATNPAATAAPAATEAAPQSTTPVAGTEATSQPTPAGAPTLPVSTAPAACKTVDSLLPKVPDEYKPSIPPVDEKTDWIKGSNDALITIIEYSDFQCPYCQLISNDMDKMIAAQNGSVRLVYRHFPLPMHNKSALAAQAAEAAGLQGKFWEMHDYLFDPENWKVWTEMEVSAFETYLKDKAASAVSGLDKAKFATDLTSDAIASKVRIALDDANKLAADQNNGLGGTPTFYVIAKGQMYTAPASITVFENVINLIKQDDKLYKECPSQTIDTKKEYTATIKTEKGDIVIKLYPDKAPTTVNSFVFLAREGYFNGNTFHRVINGFVAQTGDPTNSGMGGPGYQIDTEIAEGANFDRAGMVGMARSQDPFSNGSQFFITLDAASALNRRYTVFGEVVSGMDVVKKLTPRDVSTQESPAPGDKILSVTIEEK